MKKRTLLDLEAEQKRASDEAARRDTGHSPGDLHCGHAGNEGEALFTIAQGIQEMPDLAPPTILLPSIMGPLLKTKIPWWRRLYGWAKIPRTFSITPLTLTPVAGMLVVLITFLLANSGGGKNRQLTNKLAGGRVPVVFSFKMPEARSVRVVGSFNDWHGQDCEMKQDQREGTWKVTLWLKSGRYEYAFLVDDRKVLLDPQAAFYQADGFGNQNNVLFIGNADETSI
jgi:hypothetical protein